MTYFLWSVFLLFERLVVTFESENFANEIMKPSELPIPPNNHGIQPWVIVDKEIKVSANNLLCTIPILSTEWSITVDVRVAEYTGKWGNVFTFTNGNIGVQGNYGNRVPSLYVMPNNKQRFHISAPINGRWNKEFYNFFYQVNQTHHLEIHQRYIANGEYRYYIVFDGDEVHSVINKDARQFHNVRGYGNMENQIPNVYLSNLKLVNFL